MLSARTLGLATRGFAMCSCLLTGGCVIRDLSSSSGLKAISITVTSDTVLSLSVPASPLFVTVIADGQVVPAPQLVVTSSNTDVVSIAAGGDSLVARHVGRASITIQVLGALLTDTLPTKVQGIRVQP